jgi:hypothetical protein
LLTFVDVGECWLSYRESYKRLEAHKGKKDAELRTEGPYGHGSERSSFDGSE